LAIDPPTHKAMAMHSAVPVRVLITPHPPSC
jgi:hypothetical protein